MDNATETRATIHQKICEQMNNTFRAKNKDYGNSFKLVRDKYPNAILIRLNDKLNRLETLMSEKVRHVEDESIEDTLIDLANYCIMELVERKLEKDNE